MLVQLPDTYKANDFKMDLVGRNTKAYRIQDGRAVRFVQAYRIQNAAARVHVDLQFGVIAWYICAFRSTDFKTFCRLDRADVI
ncbi:hypothetical protein PoB_002466900 [Plakobranchus ocellatus]|uniref:Uncharacterized protein n=1 Tax=Plakobranchus ocellatus TaxID=259542 RepID=A0AAV3ZUR5_9GAST|nr:hypothetical protein PoB_002466900 [Plakobranchus ocellatus]